jgi:hypothetical protein
LRYTSRFFWKVLHLGMDGLGSVPRVRVPDNNVLQRTALARRR